MTLPGVRISVQYMMILVAIVAVIVAVGRHLIMDGSVTVELFNGLGNPQGRPDCLQAGRSSRRSWPLATSSRYFCGQAKFNRPDGWMASLRYPSPLREDSAR